MKKMLMWANCECENCNQKNMMLEKQNADYYLTCKDCNNSKKLSNDEFLEIKNKSILAHKNKQVPKKFVKEYYKPKNTKNSLTLLAQFSMSLAIIAAAIGVFVFVRYAQTFEKNMTFLIILLSICAAVIIVFAPISIVLFNLCYYNRLCAKTFASYFINNSKRTSDL